MHERIEMQRKEHMNKLKTMTELPMHPCSIYNSEIKKKIPNVSLQNEEQEIGIVKFRDNLAEMMRISGAF